MRDATYKADILTKGHIGDGENVEMKEDSPYPYNMDIKFVAAIKKKNVFQIVVCNFPVR